jgi:hypothetical protein
VWRHHEAALERRHPAVRAALAGGLEALGAVGRDVDRDAVVEVDVVVALLAEPDRPLAAALADRDLVAVEQPPAVGGVVAQGRSRDGRESHHVA